MRYLLILLCFKFNLGARILGVVPSPSYSHQVVFQTLWRELSLRGHQVVTITTNLIKDPTLSNLTEIDVSFSYKTLDKLDFVKLQDANRLTFMKETIQTSMDITEEQLADPKVQQLIRSENEHFDLVIMEVFYTYPAAFSIRFNCPFILMSSFDAPTFIYYAMGNPAHPVVNPHYVLPFFEKLTFFQRVTSVTLLTLFFLIPYLPFGYHPDQKVSKYFGEGYPPVDDILKNASFMFLNVNPLLHQIRPLLPNIIPIGGGTHLFSSKPLPKELKEILDKGDFIYFSLGTNVKIERLDKKLVETFKETFAELPYTVLWKCDLGEILGKPKNVIMSKWFPQQEIFKHHNIKLFITQGGLQSMEEAIYNRIPVLAVPFFGDQLINVKKMILKGYGLSVDHKTLDKNGFTKAILEGITNPEYKRKVEEVAALVKDQPMTGFEKAIWWTEYVIRHKGAKHLRSPAIDLPLYQYLLLDVIAFFLLIVVVLVGCLIGFVKLLLKIFKKVKSTAKLKTQ